MSLALAALQIVLAGTFFLAAVSKLLQSDEFLSALRLSHLPEGLVRALGYLFPALEAGLAFWLLVASPDAVAVAFAAAFAVLAVFTLWMGWVRMRRLSVRCGCFGPNGGEVGLATIGRNVGLMVLAAIGWLLARGAESALPGPSLAMAGSAVAGGLVISMAAALRFAWPHLTLSEDRLRTGGTAGE